MRGIWKEACELGISGISIVPALGHPQEARMVASCTGARLHLVIKGRDGLYSCDQECANYRSLKVCSHTVVAETNRELATFAELGGAENGNNHYVNMCAKNLWSHCTISAKQ